MKLLPLLPLASFATAIVLPDEHVFADIAIEDHRQHRPAAAGDFLDELKHVVDEAKDTFDHFLDHSKNYLDEAIAFATDAGNKVSEKIHETAFDVDSWLEPSLDGPRGPSPPEYPPDHRPDHPHKKRPHHGKSNLTIYQLISASKYTTKLAKLIDEDDELVQLLNGTAANYTLFAPTDRAFEKIPEHAPEPPKDLIKKVLLYHISPSFYPAARVLNTYTIPTLLDSAALGDKPQRLTVRLGLKGLAINFYSKVVATNIFAENGVIHGVDSVLLPPPSVLSIIGLLPGEFSTLSLGLSKTGLLEELNTTAHVGSTFFAPSNVAFKKLGPKINAFLFSKYGEKYLKALLKYHVVHNETLYSDAFYNTSGSSEDEDADMTLPMSKPCDKSLKGPHGRPTKSYFHLDLPTLLEDKSIAVDVSRLGPFVSIKLNRYARVVVKDGVARDGVIHLVSNVLIPPKKPGAHDDLFWQGEDMALDEFKERLIPYLGGDEQEEQLEL